MHAQSRRPSEPPVRREALIAARELRGLSREALARILNADPSTVSAWESGRRTPSPTYRPALAEALRVSDIELARMLGAAPPIALSGHVVPRDMSHYDSLVVTAGRIEVFDRAAVHGLAQTERYAAGVEAASGLSDSQIMARVDERQARQAILHRAESPLELTLLFAELVLYEVVGGDDVMAEQCDRLIELADLPNVTIRLLPRDGRTLEAANGVELLTKPGEAAPYMAVSFDPDARLRYFAHEEIDRFTALFDRLTAKALPPDQTAIRLRQIRSDYTR